MAALIVMIGQCGNQLGDELFVQLRAIAQAHGSATGPNAFFTRDGTARCVLVDTEPKVVHGVQQRHSNWIRTDNVISGQSGRGNNWGLGYYGVNDPQSQRSEQRSAAAQPAFRNMGRSQRDVDDSVVVKTLRAIHAETRRTSDCSDFDAIVLIHSLVGGTGSGLASRLAEKMRLYFIEPANGKTVDECYEDRMARADGLDGMLVEKRRARHLISIAVAPQRGGEMSTQGLNAALTLHVLHRCADAVLLLRNDDVMTGEPNSGAASSTSSLVPHCSTFKEANEVFVSLLLPLFFYGIGANSGIGPLVAQCVPSKAALTGANTILTLLPTPQRTYGRWRATAHRCRLYAISGGKQFMPGCKPEIPVDALLSSTAQQYYEAPAAAAASPSQSLRGPQLPARGRGGQSFRGTQRPPPRQTRSRWSDNEDGEAAGERRPEDDVFHEVSVALPPSLMKHYKGLRRAPVAKLCEELEGVLVMNQARELNESLLFSLLRSAAIKVKVGAFLSTYEDVGVGAERIRKAYQAVADFLSYSEEL